MAKLRKAVSYRRLERPYTRKSKYRQKSYVRGSPVSKVVRYDMGKMSDSFDATIEIVSKANLQIRHNAIESSRLACSRLLDKTLTNTGYKMKIMIYPHHILRENPLASGAGADRMSTGMKMSFGKPIGIAARVKEGKTIMKVWVQKKNLAVAREALKRASHKLPCATQLVTN